MSEELQHLISKTTSSGRLELDPNSLKEIKNRLKRSEALCRYAYELLWTHLQKPHAQIRYLAVLLVKEIFARSAVFRTLLASDFQQFIASTVELDLLQPLPPPKKCAKMMQSCVMECVNLWTEKYGHLYRQIGIAKRQLEKHPHLVGNQRTTARSSRPSSGARREMQGRFAQLKVAVEAELSHVRSNLTELQNALEVLLPLLGGVGGSTSSPEPSPSESITLSAPKSSLSFSSKCPTSPRRGSDLAHVTSSDAFPSPPITPGRSMAPSPKTGASNYFPEDVTGLETPCGGGNGGKGEERRHVSLEGERTSTRSLGIAKGGNGDVNVGSEGPESGTNSVEGQGNTNVEGEGNTNVEGEGNTNISSSSAQEVGENVKNAESGHSEREAQCHPKACTGGTRGLDAAMQAAGPDMLRTVQECLKVGEKHLRRLEEWVRQLGSIDPSVLRDPASHVEIVSDLREVRAELEGVVEQCAAKGLTIVAIFQALAPKREVSSIGHLISMTDHVPERVRGRGQGYTPFFTKTGKQVGPPSASTDDLAGHPDSLDAERRVPVSPTTASVDLQGDACSQSLLAGSSRRSGRLLTAAPLYAPVKRNRALPSPSAASSDQSHGELAWSAPDACVAAVDAYVSLSASPCATRTKDTPGAPKPETREELLKRAPVVSGDFVRYWGKDSIPLNQSGFEAEHRFYGAAAEAEVPVNAQTNLNMKHSYYKSEFEAVESACGARKADGSLCGRFDRYRCPFHGPKIARDENGDPLPGAKPVEEPKILVGSDLLPVGRPKQSEEPAPKRLRTTTHPPRPSITGLRTPSAKQKLNRKLDRQLKDVRLEDPGNRVRREKRVNDITVAWRGY
eukprot:Rmarinus@m.3515